MPHKGQNSSGGEASGPIVDPKDGVSVGPHQKQTGGGIGVGAE